MWSRGAVKGCCQSTKECERRGPYQGHPRRQVRPRGGSPDEGDDGLVQRLASRKGSAAARHTFPRTKARRQRQSHARHRVRCYMADEEKRVSRTRLRVGEASFIAAARNSKGLRLAMPIAARLTPRAERCRVARICSEHGFGRSLADAAVSWTTPIPATSRRPLDSLSPSPQGRRKRASPFFLLESVPRPSLGRI